MMMFNFHVPVKTERAVAVGSSALLGHVASTTQKPSANNFRRKTQPLRLLAGIQTGEAKTAQSCHELPLRKISEPPKSLAAKKRKNLKRTLVA
jgi:hypothetical protein